MADLRQGLDRRLARQGATHTAENRPPETDLDAQTRLMVHHGMQMAITNKSHQAKAVHRRLIKQARRPWWKFWQPTAQRRR